jgi:hypothetical protein
MNQLYKRQFFETRPSKCLQLASEIGRQVSSIEKIVHINYTVDSVVGLYRTKDGNAYQIEIKPAKYADHEKFGNPRLMMKKR